MKKTYILGLSCYYHDSSATLLEDGKVVAAAQEERFTREKHDTSFPMNAIRFCLEERGITIQDITYIAFYEKPFLKFERLLYEHLATFPLGLKTFVKALPSWIRYKLRLISTIRKKLKYGGSVLFIPHHLAHAASTFLPSPFEEAAIVTADGVGEWSTTTIGVGKKTDVKILKEISFPHSIGLLYSTITAYLGFSVNNSEYKVMGLSAYGNMNRETNPYFRRLMQVIDLKEDGSYHLDMSYFIYHYAERMPSQKLCKLLGGPIRKKESEITDRHRDIAAALQLVLEAVMNQILHHAHTLTGSTNLVLAGGVALNSVYNGKILSTTPFKKVWIQPDAGDGGTSMGAALFVAENILNGERNYKFDDIYLGPGYSDAEIEHYLKTRKINYTKYRSDDELVEGVANLIYSNKIVGWFQGRMEWGPRALGARSILANPTNKEMQKILNSKVKLREEFRPFAPAIALDDASEYFDCDDPIPEAAKYMLMVYPTKSKWHKVIPSVVHVDGSGRLQTVERIDNSLYYDTIKAFGRLSGIPILINTSLNVRGEPMVCSPKDAYLCMMGTEIDYMVMGHYLVARNENLRDVHESHEVID